jgi:thiosulfate/3-mercaptopyruvate sulfurtransferase
MLLLPAADAPTAASYARPELLIEAPELARRLGGATDLHILDARPRAQYQAGHIPGARWVDHDGWAEAFTAGQEVAAWSRRLGALGLRPDSTVIVYDDSAGKEAARIWWILRYWGVKDARLLNGGWTAWRAAAGPVGTSMPPPPPRQEVTFRAQPDWLANKDQLLENLKDKRMQVIDARTEKEYCGTLRIAKRGGSIPGAIHLDWSDLVDKKTKRFKSPEELAKLFREAGIDLKRPAVAHCQSGGRASVMVFALELMGAHDARNYYRSWAEWGNDPDTPVAKPKPKKGP